jgi:DNA-binding NarL/FixJ family response regulator
VTAVSIGVVLADDHPIVLQGLQQLFDRQDDFHVLHTARDGNEALAAVRAYKPDVLVLDIRMPGMNGLDVLRAVTRDVPECRTVILTAALPHEQAMEALANGAIGLVLKEASPDLLLECVRSAARGVQWIDKEALSGVIDRVLKRKPAGDSETGLTAREMEVMQRVAEGLRNKEIAERLAISEGTVKIHLHNIYQKLGVDGRLELVLYAQERGLV